MDTTTLTLYLDPWLMIHADYPDTPSAERLDNVRFHENVDYVEKLVGPGVGWLRMPADDWFAIGAPKVITVTVTPERGTLGTSTS